MAKAHKWKKNDKLTADRLNTMSDNINDLLDGQATKGDTRKDGVGSGTVNWANGLDQVVPHKHENSNQVRYRHPTYGTGDLNEDEQIGYYATDPTIIKSDGTLLNDIEHFAVSTHFIGTGKTETIYLNIKTNNKGEIVGTPAYVNEVKNQQIFGLNAGSGNLYFPIAKLSDNPKFDEEPMAMDYHPVTIPLVTDDASYVPDAPAGSRYTQGTKWVDSIDGSIIPVRGFNNKGGIKYIGVDQNGSRKSNAFKASIEMYGVAGSGQGNEQLIAGTTWNLNQAYNSQVPYYTGGDGLLAQWDIYAANGEHQGTLDLIGGHFDDWQLWFQGVGSIQLPSGAAGSVDWTVIGSHVLPSTAYDFKYEIVPSGTAGFWVNEYQRLEEFEYNHSNMQVEDRWTDWRRVKEDFIPFPFVDGGVSHPVEIETLDLEPGGTPSASQCSRLEDGTLHLVQVPVYGVCVTSDGVCHPMGDEWGYWPIGINTDVGLPIITGYKLVPPAGTRHVGPIKRG